MQIFSKRKGPSQNIAFLSLSAALVAILSLIASFTPFGALFLILFVPLLTAVPAYFLEGKYIPLLLLSSIALSFALSAWNYMETIFYTVPAILSGGLYGFLIRKGVPISYAAFSSALVSLGGNYLGIPLIKAIFEVEMIPFVISVFSLEAKAELVYMIVPIFLLSYSLAEIGLSHIFIEMLSERLELKEKRPFLASLSLPIVSIIFFALSIGLSFISIPASLFFLESGIYFSLFALQEFFPRAKWYLCLIGGIVFVASFFLFALLYKSFPPHGGFSLISLFFLAIDIPSFIAMLLSKKEKAEVKE